MINLNKKFLSKEELFKYITDYEVFSKYIDQEIIVGKNIYSPLRKENNPSFGFFMGEGNEICFHDFLLKLKGDCVKFVMILYNLTFYEALSKIAIDFGMENDFMCKSLNIPKHEGGSSLNKSRESAISKTMYKFPLGKKKRDWKPHDLIYWKEFGVSLKTLKKYNVEPISYFMVNGQPFKADMYAYAFVEHKDGIETYKIYQPFNSDFKWLNSHDNSIWQGWEQLPIADPNGVLVITKSLKDVMAIVENTGYNAVALQCENILPKPQVIEELKERFGSIMIFYDNDYDKEENWGQIFAQNLVNVTDFYNGLIDEKYKAKDFSDLIKKYDVEKACNIFDSEILLPF